MKVTKCAILALVVSSIQISAQTESSMQPPTLKRQTAEFEMPSPFLFRQKATSGTPRYVRKIRKEQAREGRPPMLLRQPAMSSQEFEASQVRTLAQIDQLKDQIKELRTQLRNKAQQRNALRTKLKALVSDSDRLAQLEQEIAGHTTELKTSSSNRSSTRRKLMSNLADIDLSAQLRNFNQRANKAGTEKRKLEKELDTILTKVAESIQKAKLQQLNKENTDLGNEIRRLEKELDELLTQKS